MKNRLNKAMSQALVASVLLLVTGCETVEKYSLTYRLWDSSDLSRWSEPAPDPKLALFEATNGAVILVQYDAFSEKHSTVKRRAYYLQQNEARVAAGKKPELVALSVADGMEPIAVLPTQGGITNLPPETLAYAVATKEGRGFTLHRPKESGVTSDLPVYPETSGTPIRIVLTPLAVAGDTVMVGVVAAVAGFFVWLDMGAPH